MNKYGLILILLLSSLLTEAQNIFFPSKEGVVLEYKNYDNKDTEIGTTRYTITNVSKVGNNNDMDITYLIVKEDKDKKIQFEDELTVHYKNEKLYLDMGKIFKQSILKEVGELPKNFKITSTDIITPSNLEIGEKLPDSSVNMAFKKGIINIKIAINVTDRVVESLERVVVPAGSFEAYKVNSKTSAKASFIKKKSSATEWLVKGIGMIKSESYNKKGELESYTKLISIKE